jgi:hypothetical protein
MTQVHYFAGVAQSKPWIAYCPWFRPIHGQYKLRLLTNINILSFSSAPKFALPQQTSLGKCIYDGKIANGMVGRSITSFQKQIFVLGTTKKSFLHTIKLCTDRWGNSELHHLQIANSNK